MGVRQGIISTTAATTAAIDRRNSDSSKCSDEDNDNDDDDDDEEEDEDGEVCVICSLRVVTCDSSDTDSSYSGDFPEDAAAAVIASNEKSWSSAGSTALSLGLSEMCGQSQSQSQSQSQNQDSMKRISSGASRAIDMVVQGPARGAIRAGSDGGLESGPRSVHCDWCHQCAHMTCVGRVGGFNAQAGFWKCPLCVASESKGTRRSVRRTVTETSVARNSVTPNLKRRRDDAMALRTAAIDDT
jgi:hypothetical protein